ncbi:MAG: hypothetical protein V3T31_06240 [candidate division Zixibacteria bacterium]
MKAGKLKLRNRKIKAEKHAKKVKVVRQPTKYAISVTDQRWETICVSNLTAAKKACTRRYGADDIRKTLFVGKVSGAGRFLKYELLATRENVPGSRWAKRD